MPSGHRARGRVAGDAIMAGVPAERESYLGEAGHFLYHRTSILCDKIVKTLFYTHATYCASMLPGGARAIAS